MEIEFLKNIAGAGPTFILLGFVVYALVQLLRTLTERRQATEDKLLTELAGALAELARSRDEQRRDLAELLLLSKMTLEKLEKTSND